MMDFPYSESNDRELIESWLVLWEKRSRPTNDQVIGLAKRLEAGMFAEELLAKNGPYKSRLKDDYEWIATDGELAERELATIAIGYATKYALQSDGPFPANFHAATQVIKYAISHFDYTLQIKFSAHLKRYMLKAIEMQDEFDDPDFDWTALDDMEQET
jgi:RNA polymerase primary sigma factor